MSDEMNTRTLLHEFYFVDEDGLVHDRAEATAVLLRSSWSDETPGDAVGLASIRLSDGMVAVEGNVPVGAMDALSKMYHDPFYLPPQKIKTEWEE